MAIEIPFELDTIDAIQEAEGFKELFIAIGSRVGPFIIYLLCAAFEYIAFYLVDSQFDISCLKWYEMTDSAVIYLATTYTMFLPDLIFAILGPISIFMLYNNPYGVFYNGLTSLMCIGVGVYFNMSLPFCGNPGQTKMIIGLALIYFSGLLHILNAVLNHLSFMNLDKENELYFGRIRDLIEDVRG